VASKKVVVLPGDDAAPETAGAGIDFVIERENLKYLGFVAQAQHFASAVRKVYAEGRVLTPDQGGRSSTSEFTRAVLANL
jgi:hypothetical protein